jgi:hypothetical protein
MATSVVKEEISHYRHTDPPFCLRMLAKAARAQRLPVELVWLDDEDAECAGVVAVVGVGREWIRVASENGIEHTINAWDVWDARVLDADCEAAA